MNALIKISGISERGITILAKNTAIDYKDVSAAYNSDILNYLKVYL